MAKNRRKKKEKNNYKIKKNCETEYKFRINYEFLSKIEGKVRTKKSKITKS